MHEDAMTYLKAIATPLTKEGVEIIQDQGNPGAYCIVPKSGRDYAVLVGAKGRNADIIRHLLKVWYFARNLPYEKVNMMIANPSKIETQFV